MGCEDRRGDKMNKNKNTDITLSRFGTMWVLAHIASVVLIMIVFVLLVIPIFFQYSSDDPSEKLPLNVQLYLGAAQYIAVVVTLFLLSLIQLFVSRRTIRI